MTDRTHLSIALNRWFENSTLKHVLSHFPSFYDIICVKIQLDIFKRKPPPKAFKLYSRLAPKGCYLLFIIFKKPSLPETFCLFLSTCFLAVNNNLWHESRKRHLRRPHFSKGLTKLAILPNYECPGLICLALPACRKFGLILVIKFFLVEVMKKSS